MSSEKMKTTVCLLLFVAWGLAGTCPEELDPYTDKVKLKNGQTVLCDILAEYNDRIKVRLQSGTITEIPRERIASMKKELDTPNYETLKALRRAIAWQSCDQMVEILDRLHYSHLTPEEKPLFGIAEEKAHALISQHCEQSKAIGFFQRALRRDPNLHRARSELASLLLASGDRASALLEMGELVCRFPKQEYGKRARGFVNTALQLAAERQANKGAPQDPKVVALLRSAAAVHGTLSPQGLTEQEWSHRWLAAFSGLLENVRSKKELPIASPAKLSLSAIATSLLLSQNQNTRHRQGIKQSIETLTRIPAETAFKVSASSGGEDFQIVGRFAVFLLFRKLADSIAEKDRRSAIQAFQRIRALATKVNWRLLPGFVTPSKSIHLHSSGDDCVKFMALPEARRIEKTLSLVDNTASSMIITAAIWAADKGLSQDPRSTATQAFLDKRISPILVGIEQKLQQKQGASEDLLNELAALSDCAPTFLSSTPHSKRVKQLKAHLRLWSQAEIAHKKRMKQIAAYSATIKNIDKVSAAELEVSLQDLQRLIAAMEKEVSLFIDTPKSGNFRDMRLTAQSYRSAVAKAITDRARTEKEKQEQQKRNKENTKKNAIHDVVMGFLDGQPNYSSIKPFWDPKSDEAPQTIERLLSRRLKDISFQDGIATATIYLRFVNAAEVRFEDDFKVRLIRRGEQWYVREITR